MTFQIGQKVVCVSNSPGFSSHVDCPLIEGQTYTVLNCHDGDIKVDGDSRYWSMTRFRPVTARETDISIFKAMLVVASLVLLLYPCSAHKAWIDGTPIPAWVQSRCCGPADAHHYRYDEVKVTPEGFVLPDYWHPIAADGANVFKSEDGEYWAFFATYADGNQSDVYCFFAPPGAS